MKLNKGAWGKPGTSIENKTGSWRTFEPEVTDKCIGCGTCVKLCPEGAIKIENGKAVIDYEYCKGCMLCSEGCPVKSIKKKMEK